MRISKRERKNLRQLAKYLVALPKNYGKFDMLHYSVRPGGTFVSPDDVDVALRDCGSTACAVGHGPSAGIQVGAMDFTWGEYADNNFGEGCFGWCFDDTWASVDNTAEGAGLRILYMLDYGIPEGFDVFGLGLTKYKALYQDAYDVTYV